jgi:ferredoxin-type protein NapH
MQIRTKIRRTLATLLLSAGLAYPVCAAVCPKGIGGCLTPGRCFLFTDADGNAFCDYTSRTGAPAPAQSTIPATASPAPGPTTVQVTTTPAPTGQAVLVSPTGSPALPVTGLNETATAVTRNTSGGGFFDTIHLSAPLGGTVLFLILTGIFFALIRTGVFGIPVRKTRPALALSALFGLGTSLIITCILAGDISSGTTYALIYMGAGTLLAAYLWYTGVMNRRIVLAAAATSTLAGFVFLAPIMPLELGGVVNVVTGVSALNVGVIVICAVIAFTLVAGRTFCGQICPVGSLQELASAVPVQKFVIRSTKILELIRLCVFVATVIAAISLIDLMAVTGLYDLFSLTLSASLLVAAALVLLSVFLYRPVCRILCPFGVLFSLCAEFSMFRLRRTETCIGCKKCDKTCPAMTAGEHDSKRECYLCGRCTDVCKVKGALVYSRRHEGASGSSAINTPGRASEKTSGPDR